MYFIKNFQRFKGNVVIIYLHFPVSFSMITFQVDFVMYSQIQFVNDSFNI